MTTPNLPFNYVREQVVGGYGLILGSHIVDRINELANNKMEFVCHDAVYEQRIVTVSIMWYYTDSQCLRYTMSANAWARWGLDTADVIKFLKFGALPFIAQEE